MTMTQPTIGCVQLNSQFDVDANLASIEKAIKHAKHAGVKLLILPENACRMGGQLQLSARFDALSDWFASLAAKHELFLVAGTLPCPYRPDGTPVPNKRVRQVSQLFAPDGERLARYDKIHLFKAHVADSTGSYDEGETFEPGNQLVVAQCDMASLLDQPFKNTKLNQDTLSIGMMVCFDLRFPALAQRLRQSGADVLTAPSAFTYQTGKAHWQLLLRARALDAQCFIVGAAQGGTHHGNHSERQTWGHSSMCNANGELLVSTGMTSLEEGKALVKGVKGDNGDNHSAVSEALCEDYALITAPFDWHAQQQWRQNMPIHYCHRLA